MAAKYAKISDQHAEDKPREKFRRLGSRGMRENELLAIVIGSGTKDSDVNAVSRNVVKKIGLRLLDSDKDIKPLLDELSEIEGVGPAKAVQILAAVALGKMIEQRKQAREIPLRGPEDVYKVCMLLERERAEHLDCLYLNARNVLLERTNITKGVINRSLFHPREVFARAVELRAVGLILVHNQPSGEVQPSSADRSVVSRLVKAGKLMGIEVLDFVIIGSGGRYYSHRDALVVDDSIDNDSSARDNSELYVGDGTDPATPMADLMGIGD